MLSKNFNHKYLETKWYKFWEEMKLFSPFGKGKAFCIMIPPPNITGNLHMGHAYQNTIIDSIIRIHRMKGYKVLWQMGTDHAGIATQMLLENKIYKEKKTKRENLEKKEFLQYISSWKKKSIKNISYQMKSLGSSVDWDKSRFTMDDGFSLAVKMAFIKLYEEGVIYRGKKLVNWDTKLRTAISDLEINKIDKKNKLFYIKYKIKNTNTFLIVATTRPETIFGDVAIAINPNDTRYRKFIGNKAIVPIIDREIPIITDKKIDKYFGSGCVKITPGHDFNDFEIGKNNNLKIINILNKNGTLNKNVPLSYQFLTIKNARKKVLLHLVKMKLLYSIKHYNGKISLGDRSNSLIEPLLTNQWFIKTSILSKLSILVVKKNIIKFIPDAWSKIYFNWMNKVDDWCISRQIWWGHNIPAWYDKNKNIFVGTSEKEVRNKNNIPKTSYLIKEKDVLDTWFSSALWPFATLGWPEKTLEMKEFFPTNILITGFDIIFYWVARMIMFSIKFTKNIPFKYVYIHGLIRDNQGQKMSKSKGNIIDPLDLIKGVNIEKLIKKRTQNLMQESMKKNIENNTKKEFPSGIKSYGTDALRLTLLSINSTSQYLKFEIKKLENSRNFCNKIWNASRYIIKNNQKFSYKYCKKNKNHLINIWISCIWEIYKSNIIKSNKEYRFDLSIHYAISFVRDHFCDWYLEFSKYLIESKKYISELTRFNMLIILEEILRIMHPFIPFITEELWQKVKILLQINHNSIMISKYPVFNFKHIYKDSILKVNFIKDFIKKVRMIRSQLNIKNNNRFIIFVNNINIFYKLVIIKNYNILLNFANIKNIYFLNDSIQIKNFGHSCINSVNLYIPIKNTVKTEKEKKDIFNKIKQLENLLHQNQRKINNESYINKAPKKVVEKTKKKILEAKRQIKNLKGNVVFF